MLFVWLRGDAARSRTRRQQLGGEVGSYAGEHFGQFGGEASQALGLFRNRFLLGQHGIDLEHRVPTESRMLETKRGIVGVPRAIGHIAELVAAGGQRYPVSPPAIFTADHGERVLIPAVKLTGEGHMMGFGPEEPEL